MPEHGAQRHGGIHGHHGAGPRLDARRVTGSCAGQSGSGLVTDLDTVVRAVDDPELPHVTIGDLGMVRAVEIDGRRCEGSAHADLHRLPRHRTDPGRCRGGRPRRRLRTDRGVRVEPTVEHRRHHRVGTGEAPRRWDRPTGAGRRWPGGARSSCCVSPLRLSPHSTHRRVPGATACKSLHHCDACRQPFESFKPL